MLKKVAFGFIQYYKKVSLSVLTKSGSNTAKVLCHWQTLNYSITLCFEVLTFYYFKGDLNRKEMK